MIHILKCWPEFYNEVITGQKKFEFRLNDGNYKTCDALLLQEYSSHKKLYSGRSTKVRVTSVLEVEAIPFTGKGCIEIKKCVIMSIEIFL
jgi:hypothetical protein